MRMRVNKATRDQAGSALIISLFIVMVIGIAIGSYLSLVSTQNKSVMRSLAWNAAVPAMEAGVEEALTHLRHYGITNSYFAADGWTLMPDNWYQKTVSLGNDFGYVVRIEPVEPPNIVATGITPAPLGSRSLGTTASSILRAALDADNFVRRSVLVPTRRDAMFAKAMLAKEDIDLVGNKIAADSYDSRSPLYSTGGQYDPLKRRDNGDIATNSGFIDSLNAGGADIMGNLATGPGGTVAIGPNGSVGSEEWVDGGNKGIESGHTADDMNVTFEPVELPSPFPAGTIPPKDVLMSDGTEYDYVLGSGDYVLAEVDGQILIEGDARLYVRDKIDLTGNEFIKISTNASLQIYMAGEQAVLGGNGVINESGSALNFQYWGLDSNTQVDFSGNAAFLGVVYAPEAEFTLGGGGKDIFDFSGASVSKTVKMNGHFNFHYDEALEDLGPDRGYIPTSWNEIDLAQALPPAALVGMTEIAPPLPGDTVQLDYPTGDGLMAN